MKNRIERIALGAGLIASVFGLYYFHNFTMFDGAAFFYAGLLYPIGILCFALAPLEGVLGRWVIPIYGLLWSILNWYVFFDGFDRKVTGEAGDGGLGAAVFILFFQIIGNVIPFFMRRQRWLRSRLGIALALFYPGILIFLSILDKFGWT